MKSTSIGEQIVHAAKVNRDIILPSGERTTRNWPLCLTCFKEVDACELKDVNPTSCEIVVRCYHGTDTCHEDSYKVNFGFRCDDDPLENERANWAIKRALHDMCPFQQNHQFDTSRRKG